MATDDFDQRAATWDDDPSRVERARAVAEAVARAVPLGPRARMLEYGAGTGLVTEALRARVGPVTLADSSAGMLEVLRDKVAAGTIAGARVWDLDLGRDPPPPERFDLLVTVMTLHHVSDVPAVLRAFAALLEADGRLCVADLEPEDGSFHGGDFGGHRGFAPDALTHQLEDAGFHEVTYGPCHEVVKDDRRYGLFLATATRAPDGSER